MRLISGVIACLLGCSAGPHTASDGGSINDGGPSGHDGGSDEVDGGLALLDGGRRESAWRLGLAPITDDVPRWYVLPEADRVLYPNDQTHSPITAALATHLRNVALHGRGLQDNLLMKIGDSITASSSFLHCFDGDINNLAPSWEFNIKLGGRAELADVIFHFRSGVIGRTSPFSRVSRAAKVGASADFPLTGRTPPLEVEFAATTPQFATVMYGTNDIGQGGTPDTPLDAKLTPHARHLLRTIDWLLERGVVPVMSTIPPRNDVYEYLGVVDAANAVVRAIAQGRQVPLVDYHREMLPLLEQGLSSDGVHPSVREYNTSCHFDADGVGYGYNARNLATIHALDRAMKTVVDGVSQLDAVAPKLEGSGARAQPFLVPSLPFSELRDVATLNTNDFEQYACQGAKRGLGNDAVYSVTVTKPTLVRAGAIDATPPIDVDGGQPDWLDVDLHVLDAQGACLKSGDATVVTSLQPGTYLFVVDRSESERPTTNGEYVFFVVPCRDDDRLCEDLAAAP